MAYAAASSLSQTIDLLLNSHPNCFDLKFQNQFVSLHKHTIFLASFLEESPREAIIWEETIREAAEMAEDLIELILSDSLLGRTVGPSRSNFGEGKEYQLPYGFLELERAIHQIESIAARIEGGDAGAMGGTDDEVMMIVSRLRRHSYWTLAIYGREGMGKTALARNVFNHPLIVEHFEIRAWCDVSTDYGLSQAASVLLSSISLESRGRRDSEGELNTFGDLCRALDGKKSLIVLDDVRTVKDFRRLRRMIPSVKDSRILITTRFFRLAKLVQFFHQKRFMDKESTWSMLREKIFGLRGPCPYELETLGKKIAISCRGHPLSVELVSGILAAADRTVAAWEEVLENVESIASNNGVDTMQVLSLSYTYLPHHLRPCFLYLGIFPNDKEIRVSKLVKLWVSEGFLELPDESECKTFEETGEESSDYFSSEGFESENESESECKSFEEIGEEYVEDLVRRNLVSISKEKSNGRIKSITISDVTRDLCIRQARIDNFLLQFRGLDADARNLQWCRRVSSLTCDDDFLKGVCCSTVRTIILSLDDGRFGLARWSIGNVRLLRILDLSNAYSYELPEEVFELFHLRYLAFDCMFSISEAILNLENLQTLIICSRKSGRKFGKLPEGIWRMPQLRHLSMFCLELPSHEGGTSALENLQTLSRVENFVCSVENLKMIPNLKKLVLLYTKNVRDMVEEYGEDYKLHNLINLQRLEILKIVMHSSFGEHHNMSRAFPPTVKKLNLCGVHLPWEDMELVASSLPNLRVLKLRKHACIGESWITSGGGFSRLTFLLIEESDLKNWISEAGHFPELKRLVLRRCLRLLKVPNDIGGILESIELDGQNTTLLRSAERLVEDQPKWRDGRPQICVV